jgi:hypothetical protein
VGAEVVSEMQRGEADAEASVAPYSLFYCFGCCSPPSRGGGKGGEDVMKEERRKLKLEELQRKWRERVGFMRRGQCSVECGLLELCMFMD